MSDPGMPARRAAHYMMTQIIEEQRLLSEVIGAGALDRLGADDRARAQRLTTSALRSLDRADRVLRPMLAKKPPAFVRDALRLATVEICTGGAAHGIVNSYVEIVGRNKRTSTMRGLTNAVLRKVAASGPALWSDLPIPKLPAWLRQPLFEAWGAEAIRGIEAAHFAGAPMDLTTKAQATDLAPLLGGTVLPTGSIRLKDAGKVTGLPGFETGDWWVQDAAAAIPVQGLGQVQGERVLDLCAAPGGKTLQLAARGAQVTALDASAGRLERLHENLKRTGLTAQVVCADAFDYDQGGYDAILLDAPCSATGTLRRHPDLPYAKDGSEFGGLIDLQGRLLDHALSLLKPGGRLMFCTCSLLPDEGEVQIQEALTRHTDITVDPSAWTFPGLDPAWISEEGGLRLRPDYWADTGGMDGFYAAVLRKAA